ncbi:TetR/AcrR family transcriptional regulator [Vaginisenegalia massiliensis]|uniref:TetR/AcrR family transcriptional regulator n=1 Tax=Vaginisenegalia massiliensis TaxID=2058294 RepID=UPI000F52B909|nr:TetR/AcrR family transcriptional regulator [Vaginisenegalia massiliensis]
MGKNRMNPEDRKNEIMEKAMQLFIDKGIEKTTFKDIGNSCNIARSSVYEYFRTKDEILIAYLEKSMNENEASYPEEGDTQTKLKSFIKATEQELERKYFLNLFLIQRGTILTKDYQALQKQYFQKYHSIVFSIFEGNKDQNAHVKTDLFLATLSQELGRRIQGGSEKEFTKKLIEVIDFLTK